MYFRNDTGASTIQYNIIINDPKYETICFYTIKVMLYETEINSYLNPAMGFVCNSAWAI